MYIVFEICHLVHSNCVITRKESEIIVQFAHNTECQTGVEFPKYEYQV